MLDEAAIERYAQENEVITYWMFKKKSGRQVVRLDKDRGGRRPDYHVFESDPRRGVVCEVKSIFSADYVEGRHMSMYSMDPDMDPKRPEVGVKFDPWPKLYQVLEEAVSQYTALVRDRPEFCGMPFAVALFFDFFADVFQQIPRSLADYPLISALIRAEHSQEQRDYLRQFTADELSDIIEGSRLVDLPQPTKKWALLRNRSAAHPVARKWFEPCREL